MQECKVCGYKETSHPAENCAECQAPLTCDPQEIFEEFQADPDMPFFDNVDGNGSWADDIAFSFEKHVYDHDTNMLHMKLKASYTELRPSGCGDRPWKTPQSNVPIYVSRDLSSDEFVTWGEDEYGMRAHTEPDWEAIFGPDTTPSYQDSFL